MDEVALSAWVENDGAILRHGFTVVIKAEGFATTFTDGRKSYTKGRTMKWDVDLDTFSIDELMHRLSNQLKWGTNQSATVWFFDKRLGKDVSLVEDSQLIDFFEMYRTEKCRQLVVDVTDNAMVEVYGLDVCVVPPELPISELLPENTEPEPGREASASLVAASEGPAAEEADGLEPDIFDNPEEYVGVDDEHIYVDDPATQNDENADPTDNAPFADPSNNIVRSDSPIHDADPNVFNVLHDPKNPIIAKGSMFPDITSFRKAIRHHALVIGFELSNVKTDPTRYITSCAHEGCPWRIHASLLQDDRTIQIKVLPYEHNCPTTKLLEGKMATQGWIADSLSDWAKNNPRKGAKDAKEKLEDQFGKLKYSKVWAGMKLALENIHGKYEESFQMLFNWKAEIERRSPGTIVEIELQKQGKKMCFKRIFVALKPCIDGFLAGCRPFVGVDSTALNGKYTGQLASATSVDGHNWLFYVAYAIFDSETDDNWLWFMKQLNRAVGGPTGLVIATDACKGLEKAVGAVFPSAEHKECMRHLYQNFMKRYRGPIFAQHLYPAAKSYTEDRFRWHMQQIFTAAPDAIDYLQTHHSRIWYRCGFSELSKCDYLTNNVAESFNNQIKPYKGLHLHELVDVLRELIMEKMSLRRQIGRQMEDGGILPHVVAELNKASNKLRVVKVARSDDDYAEITLVDEDNNTRRHTVDLKNMTCSCRVWQLTGKPCNHALGWIRSNRGVRIKDFVHDFYSISRFKAAYAGRIEIMRDRSGWPQVELGFKVWPPRQKRAVGRPRVQRIRGCLEGGEKK